MKKIKRTREEKLKMFFGVKTNPSNVSGFVQKVDDESRIVKAVGNTYFFIDSDMDMLIPGCAVKSIEDRGPNSKATAKIKHQSDHVLNTKNSVGRFTVLDERKVDGKDVLYFESFIPETRKGDDDLVNYKEGIYDNHSIGFRYKNLVFARKDSVNEVERAAWDEFYPKALNPEIADAAGFFWVVKEIELFEISVVSFGANQLTPNLSGKSAEDNNRLKTEILERLEDLVSIAKSGSKRDHKQTELEKFQLKQLIADLELKEPSKKSTHEANEPDDQDIPESEEEAKKNYFTNIFKNSLK